ncbi:hypothetical protein ADK75_07140 [Streptomyces virginiae]|uniref:5'-nucleotidase SurE n=1 Tax=Streptomyces virginiae TaxID=1961 RepID=A0A0L8N1S1_STRVG|nr:hypothetical protein ADK75_07140 [Streptomyces virginiae]
MRVLITNDDGIGSSGIKALAEIASSLATSVDVWTVAPASQRSGTSHAMTFFSPIRVSVIEHQSYAVEGNPVDCVFLALNEILPARPDLILSGINEGPNLGDDIYYSGTAAAAAEGALQGIPSIAVSLAVDHSIQNRGNPNWSSASRFTTLVARHVLENGITPNCYANLNVPDLPAREVKGLRVCGLGRRRTRPHVLSRRDAHGAPYHWISSEKLGFDNVPGSDGVLLDQGFATLTPVRLSVEDRVEVAHMSSMLTSEREIPHVENL